MSDMKKDNLWLMQGDCLDRMKEIPDGGVDMVLTDIPYGSVNRQSNGLRSLDKGKADVVTFDLNRFLFQCERVSKGYVVIFCGKEQFSHVYEYFATKKGTTRPLIWEKSNPSPMNGQHIYLSGVEMAVWFKKSGHKTFNAHCKNSVFKHPNGRSKNHPTEKNINLWNEILKDCSSEHQTILDPCMGSGTTGVACSNLNRKFIGIELDAGYFKIAQERIEKALEIGA
jgi:DNA modification methylase